MAILQIAKIQQRSGNLIDLPQLDEAEFGWASDQKRLFIGKTTPNENVEVLTSYSTIAFNQIDGVVGNINISNATLSTGQVLAYNGSAWVNTGRDAGGLLTLGDIGNVKIDGGAIGFVLQTDGSGNLSWTPKSTIVAYIENITQADPAVVTTVNNHYLTKGAQVTITNAQGMTEVNGNSYYANVLTSNTFSLYSDSALTTTVDSTGFGAYSFTNVTDTTTGTNEITVGDSTQFSANSAVQFVGDMTGTGISANTTYYILGSPPDGTHIKIATSPDSNTSNVVQLQTVSMISANVYQTGGQIVASSGATTFVGAAAGANTAVQYANSTGQLGASSNFTFDYANNIMTVNGNIVAGNINISNIANASRFVSTITTGIAPLQVVSTTRVANLNVATSGIANTVNDAAQPNITSLGTLSVLGVNGNITAANITANTGIFAGNGAGLTNLASGNIVGQVANALVAGTVYTAAQPNITSVGTLTSLTVTGNTTVGNLIGPHANGNSSVNIPAANGNINLTAVGNVTMTIGGAGANITGTLGISGNTTTGNLIGPLANGNSNVNIPAANGNVNISAAGNANILIVTGTGANVTGYAWVTGLVTAGSGFNTGGNILGGNVYANSGTIGASLLTGTLTTAAQPNITSVGTLTAVNSSGNVTAPNVVANTGAFYGNAAGLTNIPAGNISGQVANALVAGTVYTASQPNITSVGTLTSLTVTGNVGANNLSASNNASATYLIPSVNNNVTAAGTNQGTATLIASQVNVIATVNSGTGVIMPATLAGMRITLINTSANTCLVYPASGGVINSLSTNAAFSLVAGARLDFQATSTTQWYTLNATYS